MSQYKPMPNTQCKVVIRDGYQIITMPDGTIIPHQVFCRVTDVVNERPYAIVKVYLDLHDSETVNNYKSVTNKSQNANPEQKD